MARGETELFENARVVLRNFSGKEDQYNRQGDRNFLLLVDEERAGELASKGWLIKHLKPRDDMEDAVPQPYIKVAVSYDNIAPTAYTVTSKKKTLLNDETIVLLDQAEVSNWDIIITPYDWEVNGKTGRKAYLKSLYAVLVEDDLMSKYESIPDHG